MMWANFTERLRSTIVYCANRLIAATAHTFPQVVISAAELDDLEQTIRREIGSWGHKDLRLEAALVDINKARDVVREKQLQMATYLVRRNESNVAKVYEEQQAHKWIGILMEVVRFAQKTSKHTWPWPEGTNIKVLRVSGAAELEKGPKAISQQFGDKLRYAMDQMVEIEKQLHGNGPSSLEVYLSGVNSTLTEGPPIQRIPPEELPPARKELIDAFRTGNVNLMNADFASLERRTLEHMGVPKEDLDELFRKNNEISKDTRLSDSFYSDPNEPGAWVRKTKVEHADNGRSRNPCQEIPKGQLFPDHAPKGEIYLGSVSGENGRADVYLRGLRGIQLVQESHASSFDDSTILEYEHLFRTDSIQYKGLQLLKEWKEKTRE